MNKRILVIDDNSEIHKDIKKILECAEKSTELDELEKDILGTSFTKAPQPSMIIDSALQGDEGVLMGFEAWKEGNPYALAFVDIRMPPGLNGIKTIKKIQEFDKNLQFVIITAFSDFSWDEINSEIDSQGNLLILKKPFDSIEIRQLASALTKKWTLSYKNQIKSQALKYMNHELQKEIKERKILEINQGKLLFELDARIKELNCYYELTKLIQIPNITLDDIFSRFIQKIPFAFQNPDKICVRIWHNENVFLTGNFKKTQRELTSTIACHGKNEGSIEVFSTEKKTGKSSRSFSKEEKILLDVLAKQIGKTIERIQAEKRVKESEKRIRLIMDSTAEGIYGLDLEGYCTFCNRACHKLLGYTSQKDFIGKQMHGLIHHTKANGSRYGLDECRILKSCRNLSEFHSDKEVFWKKDGTCVNVEYWAYPVFKNAEIVGVVVTFIDISERICAEKERQEVQIQLRQAQKMEAIGTLAGGIAHDFNNILMPLLGYAELLKEELPPDTPLQEYVAEIIQASLRAKDLVKQILTFSRQSGQRMERIKIQGVVKEALKLLRASISTNIEIIQNIDSECGRVIADSTQVHQVIINLATNAYHSMENTGGTMTVSLEQINVKNSVTLPGVHPGQYACLTVADTGVGIDKNVIEKILDPYFTTKKKGKGTGLGLSVVQGIVKSCGGNIFIDSQVDQGTRVSVYLPIPKTVSKAKETIIQQTIPGGSERILLVDDELPIVNVQYAMLKRLGYDVSIFTESLEALEAFKNNPNGFDIIITDMNMPDMTGVQLSKEIKQIRPDMPVIMCTGFIDPLLMEEHQLLGVDVSILKPVVNREMASAIRSVLEKKI